MVIWVMKWPPQVTYLKDRYRGHFVVYCDTTLNGDCLVMFIFPFIVAVIMKYFVFQMLVRLKSSTEQRREGWCTFIVCLLLVLFLLLLYPAHFSAREELQSTITLQLLICTLVPIFLLLHVLLTFHFMFAASRNVCLFQIFNHVCHSRKTCRYDQQVSPTVLL